MENVEFLDSTGLGVLVGGLKRVRAHDGSLRLVCTQERILKIFRITGLTKVFPIHSPSTRPSRQRTDGPSSWPPSPSRSRHCPRTFERPASWPLRSRGARGWPSLLDEIRLAVSEACSLAVRFHLAHASAEPVQVRLTDSSDQFTIEVADAVARPALDLGSDVTLDLDAELDLDLDGPTLDVDSAGGVAATDLDLRSHERIGLAVINGLVDDVSVGYLDDGSVVTMRWPIA